MPSNMPNRDWRGGQSSPAKSTARSWRKPGKSEPRRPWSRNRKRAAAAVALAGLVALLVVVINYLRPPQPTLLVLQGSAFDTNLGLPTDVYGWKTLQELTEVANEGKAETSWFTWRRGNLNLAGTGPGALSADWLGGNSWYSDEQNVLIYLATHGGADKNGAFLFYENSDQGIERLYVRDLLARFKDKALAKKNIVLLLDATQIDACPGQGLLYNDFARQIKQEVEDSKLPNLLVLCSSGPDQKSWVSEEWQQSVFGHFVVEALKGASASEGKITVATLRDYVRAKVKNWVADNRDAVQEPFLIGDDKRARETALRQISGQSPAGQTTEDTPEDSVPKTMEPVWKEAQQLNDAIPSPAVYSPYLWRRYRDTLIRYEELVRAGDPTGAADRSRDNLHEALVELAGQIAKERQAFAGFDSLTTSLPMSVTVAAGSTAPSKQLQDAFRAWMDDKTAATGDRLKEQKKTASNWNVTRYRLLLDEAATRLGDPKSNSAEVLERAGMSLADLEQGAPGIRPVEAHLLFMLSNYRDKASAPPADLLRLALEVCRLAETTALAVDPKRTVHPYSEQVYPWIRAQVEVADVDRRAGENRLFGSTNALWQKARADLEKAKKEYEQAAADAAAVRSALDLRDRAEADLPYYTAWLARRSSERNWSEAETRALWADVHGLDELLQKPGTETLHPADHSTSLADLTQRTQKSLQKLHDVFSAQVTRLTSEIAVQSQAQRQDIADVLTVPLVPAVERVRLLTMLRKSSGELNKATEKNAAAREDAEQAHLSDACRQGRLAFAMLGGTRDDLRDANASLTPVADKDRTRANLNTASDELGRLWQARPGAVHKDIEDARQKTDAAQALPLLARADQKSRLLDGAASVAREPFLPADGFRRANMHGLLLWLAQRTATDHWWSDHPNDPVPYYVAAGKAFVADAGMIATRVEQGRDKLVRAWLQEADTCRDQWFKNVTGLNVDPVDAILAERGTYKPLRPPQLTITSEGSFDVAYKLQADKGMPPDCTPLAWLDNNAKSAKVQTVPYRERALVTLTGVQPVSERYTVKHTLTEKQDGTGLENDAAPPTAKVVFHAFYRGQVVDRITDVTFYLKPDTVAYHYPPKTQKAQIAAIGDNDVADGTIAIVLDCSGSMGVEGYTRDSDCKYHRAITALQTVLHEVPPTVKIGIWLFGQKGNEAPPPIGNERPYAEPELRSRDDIDALMERLRGEEPAGVSPILQYARAAKNALVERTPTGLRTLLVLTDGDDNEWDGAVPDNAPIAVQQKHNQSVHDGVMSEFGGGDVSISMLLFHTSKRERDNAEAQFGVLNRLPKNNGLWLDTDFGHGGFTEKAQQELLAHLRQALRPRLVLIHDGARQDASPFVHFFRPNEPTYLFDWTKPMPAGDYQAILYRQVGKSLKLAPDDQLLIRLQRTNPGDRRSPVTLVREVWGNLPQYRLRSRQAQRDTLATVMSSRLVAKMDGFLDLFFTVENTVDRGEQRGFLQQVRPGFTWVEVQPEGSKPGAAMPELRWGNLSPYPAPAWDAWLPNWPSTSKEQGKRPMKPRLMIWSLSEDAAADLKPGWINYQPGQSDGLKALRGVSKDLPTGENVVIEDIIKEPHDVVVGKEPNETPRLETKDCLVVRLHYSGDEPVWADLLDHRGGSEHRFYRKAHMATVFLWGGQVDSLGTGTVPFRLNLRSISDVKKNTAAIEPPNISVQDD